MSISIWNKVLNTVEFSSDPEKNVTVILGENTGGKTTLGLKYNRKANVDDRVINAVEIYGDLPEYKGKTISSSDINAETIHASIDLLNYLYRIVMLNDKNDEITDEERIANAFKTDNNQEKLDINIELMNSYARGGVEVLFDKFQGLADDEDEIYRTQLALVDELGNRIYDDYNY